MILKPIPRSPSWFGPAPGSREKRPGGRTSHAHLVFFRIKDKPEVPFQTMNAPGFHRYRSWRRRYTSALKPPLVIHLLTADDPVFAVRRAFGFRFTGVGIGSDPGQSGNRLLSHSPEVNFAGSVFSSRRFIEQDRQSTDARMRGVCHRKGMSCAEKFHRSYRW